MNQPCRASEHSVAGDGALARQLQSYLPGVEALPGPLGPLAYWPQSLKTALTLLLNLPYPMLLVWGRDRLLFYNQAWTGWLGEEPAQTFGYPLQHQTVWSEFTIAIEQVFANGQSLAGQANPWPIPTVCTYNWSYSPLWDEAGQVGGVVVAGGPGESRDPHILMDGVQVTAETLQQRAEQLRLITNALPVLIAYVDQNHHYRFNSQTYETWFGQPVQVFTGKHVRDVLGETAYAIVRPYMEQALAGHRVSYESQLPYQTGGTRHIKADYVPHITAQGEVAGYFSLVSDISDLKQTEASLRQSEERFRLVTQAVSGLIFDWNLQTNQVYRSDKLFDLIGVEAVQVPGAASWWHDRIHPDDRLRMQPQILEVLASDRTVYNGEYRVRHEDGHWIDVWEQACLLRDEQGQVTRIVGCTVDISDRKRAEQDLRESERRFRRLVESNMFGVAFGDFRGGIHYANDYFINTVGYSRTEIESQQIRWTHLTPPEFLPLDHRAMNELKARGVATPFEKEYIRKDGSRVPILIGAALLQEPDDGQPEIIAFYLDLTEQKRAEAEREGLLLQAEAAREQAETANRVKDEFLAVLSHELRSPLNPILGWSRLLQTRQFAPQETQQALQTIERNAKLQTQLIEDLLDVSRILQGKMVLNICPVNLVAVIEAALETVRLAAEAKQIQIQPRFSLPSIQTSGDATRLQQIIWNLLSNAIKFTPPGGQVHISLQAIGHYTEIQVKDSGEGIHPDFLPYVFDYFRQADGKITRKFGGLGLGLAIVRHLSELHGGTVEAESPGEQQGATFTVRLPLIAQALPTATQAANLSPTQPFQHLKILLVDDDVDMRDLMEVILAEQDVQVRVAASAAEALVLFDQQYPDLLISDIGMPEMDGYMLMQQIRTRPPDQGGQVPAIALTAFAGEYNHQRSLQAGFQQHLAKPIDPDDLLRAIAQLIVLQ